MNKSEALKIRDGNRPVLIGRIFSSDKSWEIKDIIVSNRQHLGDIYQTMWQRDITNEAALTLYNISDNDYDVFVISHQWPWGSGDIRYKSLDDYYRTNPR